MVLVEISVMKLVGFNWQKYWAYNKGRFLCLVTPGKKGYIYLHKERS